VNCSEQYVGKLDLYMCGRWECFLDIWLSVPYRYSTYLYRKWDHVKIDIKRGNKVCGLEVLMNMLYSVILLGVLNTKNCEYLVMQACWFNGIIHRSDSVPVLNNTTRWGSAFDSRVGPPFCRLWGQITIFYNEFCVFKKGLKQHWTCFRCFSKEKSMNVYMSVNKYYNRS
jgi:hypothetical protein